MHPTECSPAAESLDVKICVLCNLPQLRSGQKLQPKQGWNPALAPGQILHPSQYQVAVEGNVPGGSFHGWGAAAGVKVFLPGQEVKVKPGMG